MKLKDPFSTFDWYFTDASKDAARYLALENRPSETSILMELISADSLVHFALWSELPSNHPVAELWLETQTDLQATIYLAYGGFFRQAFTVLRSWFEIAVHGVFFSAHYGQSTSRYEQWRNGKREAPANMRKIAASLAARSSNSIKLDEAAIFQKLDPIYSLLAQQVHGQGLDVYDLQAGRDNVPRYLSKSYDLWFKKLLDSFDAVCFLYWAFFQDEIASYLTKSGQEKERFCELKNVLVPVMPEFGKLAASVLLRIEMLESTPPNIGPKTATKGSKRYGEKS
jgi:hypothetical protein